MTDAKPEQEWTVVNKPTRLSQITRRTILVSPLIFGPMVVPSDSDSAFLLICTGVIVAASGLMPLGIPRRSRSVSVACGIIFVLGCGIGGLGLANILEPLFPNFPNVSQWIWIQWLPSAFENLAILVWIYVVLHITPVTRSLFISAVFVAAAAGYTLTSDALAIRDALVFGVTREVTDWEEGVRFLLNGCALAVWARLIIRKLAATSPEKFLAKCILFIGVVFILGGISLILWDIFT